MSHGAFSSLFPQIPGQRRNHGTEKQKQSIKQYLAKVFNGQYDVVTDIGNLGLQYAGSDRRTQQNIVDIWTTREKLLKSFYSDIGVKSAFEKRSNSVVEEVEADTSLLLLNISDMIKCRQDGCEAVNDMYGTNWTVRIADEIEYNTENAKDYPKTIEKLFELKNIPEGYALEDETSDEISSELYFVKDDEHYLDFQQFTKDSYSSVSDGEFSAPEKIKDGAQQFIIRTSGKMIMLVWEKDGYVFEMTGFLGKNEMLKFLD